MANEVNITFKHAVVIGGQTIGGVDLTIAADYQQVFRQAVPVGADYEIDLPIDVSTTVAQAIHAADTLTICTNAASTSSSPAPTQTIDVKKNALLSWNNKQPLALQLFTADVTKLYVTNDTTASVLLQVGIGAKAAPTGEF